MPQTIRVSIDGDLNRCETSLLDFVCDLARQGYSLDDIAFALGYAAGYTELYAITQYQAAVAVGAMLADKMREP